MTKSAAKLGGTNRLRKHAMTSRRRSVSATHHAGDPASQWTTSHILLAISLGISITLYPHPGTVPPSASDDWGELEKPGSVVRWSGATHPRAEQVLVIKNAVLARILIIKIKMGRFVRAHTIVLYTVQYNYLPYTNG